MGSPGGTSPRRKRSAPGGFAQRPSFGDKRSLGHGPRVQNVWARNFPRGYLTRARQEAEGGKEEAADACAIGAEAAEAGPSGRLQICRVDLPPECNGTDDCALRSRSCGTE